MSDVHSGANTGHKKTPPNGKIDDKVLKKMAGDAISGIDGLLGLKSAAGFFSDHNDPAKGITIGMEGENEVMVSMKAVAESGKSIPDVINQITEKVTNTLEQNAGVTVKGVHVEVADVMSRDEYRGKATSLGDMVRPAD